MVQGCTVPPCPGVMRGLPTVYGGLSSGVAASRQRAKHVWAGAAGQLLPPRACPAPWTPAPLGSLDAPPASLPAAGCAALNSLSLGFPVCPSCRAASPSTRPLQPLLFHASHCLFLPPPPAGPLLLLHDLLRRGGDGHRLRRRPGPPGRRVLPVPGTGGAHVPRLFHPGHGTPGARGYCGGGGGRVAAGTWSAASSWGLRVGSSQQLPAD